MQSLPPSCRVFISSLRRQPNITLQSLITDLIQEETLMKDMSWNNESQSALYTKRKIYNYGTKKNFLSKRFHKATKVKAPNILKETKMNHQDKRSCFYCKKLGHLIKDCRLRIAAEKENHNNYNKRQINTITKSNRLYVVAPSITQGEPTSSWYVDSGATQHMCHEFDAFINYN